VSLSIIIAPVTYLAIADLLSRPKPVKLELISVQQAEVLGFRIVPDEAIYVLLGLPNRAEPRYYKIPWTKGSRKTARKLQQGWQERKKKGGKLLMVRPFGGLNSKDKVRFTHPDPPHSERAKQVPHGTIPEYNQ